MPTFKAIVIEKSDGGQKVGLTDFDEVNLMEGDVTVRVEWSTVNYKDGLAVTGKAPVVRRFPMIAGIDLAGTVEFGLKRGDLLLGREHLTKRSDRRMEEVVDLVAKAFRRFPAFIGNHQVNFNRVELIGLRLEIPKTIGHGLFDHGTVIDARGNGRVVVLH